MVLEIIGDKNINKIMPDYKYPKKKKNPIAQDLRQEKYKQRVVKNKKVYNRKKIKNID